MKDQCTNCANGTRMGKVIRCEVTRRVKTPPYTKCGNWERARVQKKLFEEEDDE